MDKFDLISPLDYRYAHGKYSDFLGENARVRYQARVEAALAKALVRQGVCSAKIAGEIAKAAAKVRASEVYAEEAKIKHDVRALANVIRNKVPKEARPFVHFGATSYDIVDTASALRYKDTTLKLLLPELKKLQKTWIKIALREKATVQVGRTHGQFASPITFGFFMAGYVNRLGDRISSLQWCAENLKGKFSGAVGAYNATSLIVKDPLKLEADIMGELSLKASLHSTQIVEPESLEDLMHCVMSCFAVLANFADDMRHLQRSEISEVAESFGSRQVGSSTMPHKRNPINFENVKSLYKQFMPRMTTIYLDAVSEHQRDLTNSASARFIPELYAGLLVSTERLQKVSENLVVDRKSMKENFSRASGSIIAEPLYMLLASKGHTNAHEAVRLLTLKAGKSGEKISMLALASPELRPYMAKFSKKELQLIDNPEKYTGLSVKKTVQVCAYWKKKLGR